MSCPCRDCEGETIIRVGVPLSKAERRTILDGLSKLDYGFAKEIAARLERTYCDWCKGTGLAPYVGGDDDDAPCEHCHRSGFKTKSLL